MTSEVSIPTDTLKQYSNKVCEAACFFDAIGKMIKRHTAANVHQGHGEPFTDAELEGLAHGFEPVLSELLLVVDELDMRVGKSVTNGE
ncbi:MAG: hypothetical protein ACRBB4_16145 [Neptuniibacter sp.]